MRPEIQNAIRLIHSGDPVNVEMALHALAPLMLHSPIYPYDRREEVEAVMQSIMARAFSKYFAPFGIMIQLPAQGNSALQLRTKIGEYQYLTGKESLLLAILSNPGLWKGIIQCEVKDVLYCLMNDPMSNNDWKP